MPDTRTLLLEIGVEEIPALYLEPAAQALAKKIEEALSGGIEKVEHGEIVKLWTPRRLALLVKDTAIRSLTYDVKLIGPSEKDSLDANNNWTTQAEGFARASGCTVEDLKIEDTPKGKYTVIMKKVEGNDTLSILQQRLPKFISSIPFPKNMRWPQAGEVTFARPIRWLCVLFGDEVVEFESAGLKSSGITYGHRFAHPEAIVINNPDEYVQKLKEASVIVDPAERRKQIVAELEKAAKELDSKIFRNDELLDEVVNLVEFPRALVCDLGAYTDLPLPVLTAALAKHQRAFVVGKVTGWGWGDSQLAPYFLVVTNSPKLDPDLAHPWFERMAVSRLEDADFFIKEDLKKGLEPLIEEESRVEWVKGIGTLSDKTRWLTELGISLGTNIDGFDKETYIRAAYLAKADLLTNLVREKEFTSLQGIAGAIYTERSGEKPEVSNAIGQQYTDSPTSNESAILAISDRLLNIAATFIVGKPPKGSSDPFALRRQAAAIMKIIIDRKLPVSLPAALDRVLQLIGKGEDKSEAIHDFLTDRLRLFLTDQDFAYDWVDAVLAVAGDGPYGAYQRLAAFRELDKGEEFRLVAVGQKRVANITRELADTPDPDTSLFGQEEEEALWKESELIRPKLDAALDKRNYRKALELLLSIRPAIDRFFDEVFVMVEEEKVRTNRLHLLAAVRNEFLKVADFSRIVVEG